MIFFSFFSTLTHSSATDNSTILFPKSTMCCLAFQSCDHIFWILFKTHGWNERNRFWVQSALGTIRFVIWKIDHVEPIFMQKWGTLAKGKKVHLSLLSLWRKWQLWCHDIFLVFQHPDPFIGHPQQHDFYSKIERELFGFSVLWSCFLETPKNMWWQLHSWAPPVAPTV